MEEKGAYRILRWFTFPFLAAFGVLLGLFLKMQPVAPGIYRRKPGSRRWTACENNASMDFLMKIFAALRKGDTATEGDRHRISFKAVSKFLPSEVSALRNDLLIVYEPLSSKTGSNCSVQRELRCSSVRRPRVGELKRLAVQIKLDCLACPLALEAYFHDKWRSAVPHSMCSRMRVTIRPNVEAKRGTSLYDQFLDCACESGCWGVPDLELVFHGTLRKNVDSILKNGLTIRSAQGAYGEGFYLSQCPRISFDYCRDEGGKSMIVLVAISSRVMNCPSNTKVVLSQETRFQLPLAVIDFRGPSD
eukprot:jgi/Mesvir1/14737/Mv05382-RA.1